MRAVELGALRGRPAVAEGFGMVELLVAMVILATVALGLGGATARLGRTSFEGTDRLAAMQLVEERVGWILIDPVYDSLEVRYAGTEIGLASLPDATRETRIRQVRQPQQNGRVLDYKVVTVTVRSPRLKEPVSRTVTVAPR